MAGRDGDDGSIREQEAFTILFEEGADVLAVDQVGLVGAQEAMVGEQVLEVAQGFGDQQFGAIAEVYIGVGVFGLAGSEGTDWRLSTNPLPQYTGCAASRGRGSAQVVPYRPGLRLNMRRAFST